MPPRLPLRPQGLRQAHPRVLIIPQLRTYAVAATTQKVLPTSTATPITTYPSTQPPSHRPPEFRKSQLLRQYASLLRSTPLFLIFQHNNLKSTEWVGIRRELTSALQKADRANESLAAGIKLQTVQTGIFTAALKVTEFFDPVKEKLAAEGGAGLTHTLSKTAHEYVAQKKLKSHPLAPLLSGPLVVLTFPTVSPVHLAAALSILAPSPPKFPAPTRKGNPGYHDAAVQNGISKLLLLGAWVEGQVFDVDGAKWVGGIEGGMEGLRATLVGMLQSIPGGLVSVLEGVGKSLWLTVEGRKSMLEEEEKGVNGSEGEAKAEEN